MKIRKTKEEDLAQIAGLYSLFWGKKSDLKKMKDKFRQLATNSDYIILCAEINNRIAGTITGMVCEDLYGVCKPFLVMENLVVDTDLRKQGVGAALMNELERIGKEQGCTQIMFITETDRREAIAFYESLGYNAYSHTGFKKSL